MLVLGVTFSKAAHDSAAALVHDGRIVAAVEQERISRIKHDGAFPHEAISYCLSEAGVTLQDIDQLAFGDRPYKRGVDSEICQLPDWYVDRLIRDRVIRRRTKVHRAATATLAKIGIRANVGMVDDTRAGLDQLRERFGPLPRLSYHGHHASHAAAAFHTSGWDDAAVVTVDGRGHFDASVIWYASRDGLRRVWSQAFRNSLGVYYLLATNRLGFGEFAEGKTMGLASYGDPARFAAEFSQILQSVPGDDIYRLNGYDALPEEVVPTRMRQVDALADPYPDFAAAVQHRLEHILENIVRHAIKLTGCRRVCFGGGVALNCSANGKLRAKNVADELWVFPACGDAGLSLGAAFMGCNATANGTTRLDHAYLGPSSTEAAIRDALEQSARCDVQRHSNVARDVAKELASGAVIGWYQGRTEFGPRALGNRSILADPRTVEMRDRVNRIKLRELWRPLAPVVSAERAHEFFEMAGESPFMLFATPVRQQQRARVPAIVHVDGTARPQTVRPDQNPSLHALLTEFAQLTGVPMLINTSFNRGPEPIVCTAADALKTFLDSELDILILDEWVVRKTAGGSPLRSPELAAKVAHR